MVPLKAYLISLGPPSPQLIKYIVTFLLACWGWNMLFGRRHWAAKGKVRASPRFLPSVPVSEQLSWRLPTRSWGSQG